MNACVKSFYQPIKPISDKPVPHGWRNYMHGRKTCSQFISKYNAIFVILPTKKILKLPCSTDKGYYAPRLGRFTQSDPAMDGTNWYIYCGNNPIIYIDPSGLAPGDLQVNGNNVGNTKNNKGKMYGNFYEFASAIGGTGIYSYGPKGASYKIQLGDDTINIKSKQIITDGGIALINLQTGINLAGDNVTSTEWELGPGGGSHMEFSGNLINGVNAYTHIVPPNEAEKYLDNDLSTNAVKEFFKGLKGGDIGEGIGSAIGEAVSTKQLDSLYQKAVKSGEPFVKVWQRDSYSFWDNETFKGIEPFSDGKYYSVSKSKIGIFSPYN